MDNEFLLQDRVQKIKQVIEKYGEENFYISFSGGKDSTVLSALIDEAIPKNTIPRVYADTGIELKLIREFVLKKRTSDKRVVMLKPSTPIIPTLQEYGYPFKSKQHAKWVDMFQRNGRTQSIENYLASDKRDKDLYRTCPKKLRYQFSDDFRLRISDKCCAKMKEEPLEKWKKENGKKYGITGIMREEGGRRMSAQCLAFKGNKLISFQPMAVISKEWENWFIEEHKVEICELYLKPYELVRTGCKGCPFAINLQKELDMLERFFPAERKQCERIWQPVYKEYRRLHYRLKPLENGHQITIDDFLKEVMK